MGKTTIGGQRIYIRSIFHLIKRRKWQLQQPKISTLIETCMQSLNKMSTKIGHHMMNMNTDQHMKLFKL